MHQANQIKTAAKVAMPLLAFSLILLPVAARGENEGGTGSSASGEQQSVTGIADVLRPFADWFRAGFESLVSGFDSGEPRREAGTGTGEPQRGAGNGTGEPQRGAGNGTGEPQRGAGNGTGNE